MHHKYLIISSLLFLLIGCNNDVQQIEGFDPYVWKRDKYGCSEERASMAPSLTEAKQQILGLSEPDIVRLLGKPDEQELHKRNQKSLIYYIEPGAKCQGPENTKANPSALYIRLNALGMASELFIRNRIKPLE